MIFHNKLIILIAGLKDALKVVLYKNQTTTATITNSENMAITRSHHKQLQQVQQQPVAEATTTTPQEMLIHRLEALAPHIAAVKVDTPENWEGAYQGAEGPHADTSTTDLVHLIGNTTSTWLAPPSATMTPHELAGQMKKIKFAWARFGMYALEGVTDPNQRIKGELVRYQAGQM